MPEVIFLLLLFFIIPTAQALETVTLSFKQLKTQGWHLQDVTIALTAIEKKTPQLQLSIAQLFLPKPFDDLKLLQVHCTQFNWGNNEIHCLQGNAQLQSKLFNAPRFNFSFHITQKQSQFQIKQLQLLDGSFDLHGTAQPNQWQLSLNGKKIGLTVLHKLLFPQLKLTSGTLNLSSTAQGNNQGLSKFKIQAQANNLTLQTADGTQASEALKLAVNFNATQAHDKLWLWESNNVFQHGNFYSQPLYLENKGNAISLQGQGYWDAAKQEIEVNSAKFIHPNVGFISMNGVINHQPTFSIAEANFYAHISNLETASTLYLAPFTSATTLEELGLLGHLEGGMTVKKQAITEAYLISNDLVIKDKKQHFDLQGGIAALNWSTQANFAKKSMFSWQKFNLFDIPLEQSYFSLSLKKQKIALLEKATVPLLQGQIKINQFDWQAVKNKPAKVHFSGQIEHISLEKLAEALAWRSLPGSISGEIPSVNFADGKLSLEGGLKISVFDGEIKINQLALSGLMTDFSQFYSDIAINNLDLELLTQQFSFGSIQGRLSGYINDLYLENWQPVGFKAWLGTPEGDHSTHQISQKAVENLASIGGGGLVDFISRTALSVFDNFDYAELGLGCYLHQGVCQLTGVAPANYGYYIVKGGGLPRIDVMGYNTRIDWAVLQERLQRINQSSSDAVIK